MRRVLLLSPVIALLLVGCTVPPEAAPPPGPGAPPATVAPTWVDEMLNRINAERAAVGAAPLRLCGRLNTAAQRHSEDQAATSRMSHTGSNGSTMRQRIEGAGYLGWTALAENVAAGYGTVPSVMSGWMGSAGHRTNLLSPTYEHVGVGRAASASGTLYWTQNFGRSGSC
jgi:uncharacterized protein YkwD